MKNKILLILIIGLILLSGIEFVVNGEITSGEEKVEEIGQRQVNTFDPFLLILIFVILALIFVFILIVAFASKIKGSNKPIWISAAIGFLVGLSGSYVTVLPILYLLSFFGIFLSFFGVESLVVGLAMALFLAPFVYANIGALIGVIIKNKLKKRK